MAVPIQNATTRRVKHQIAHSKTKPRNKQKKTQKETKKTQWSSVIIFGSIDYKTVAKSRGA